MGNISRGSSHALFVLALFAIAQPASAEVCAPRPDQWYSSKYPLATRKQRVLLVTHASREFNSSASTITGIQDTINLLTPNSEVIYLHRGGFKNYMYPSCEPDYFYKSQGGEVKLDLESSDTVVMIGGYYSYCQGDTYISVSGALRKLKTKKDMRIVYVMDGSFEALGGLETAGGIDYSFSQELMARVGLTFNYAHMAQVLAEGGWKSDLLETMFASVYKSRPFPTDYSVNAHIRNHYWKGGDWLDWNVQTAQGGPKIDVYYLESKDLKEFFNL
jgi:hypothetical protein